MIPLVNCTWVQSVCLTQELAKSHLNLNGADAYRVPRLPCRPRSTCPRPTLSTSTRPTKLRGTLPKVVQRTRGVAATIALVDAARLRVPSSAFGSVITLHCTCFSVLYRAPYTTAMQSSHCTRSELGRLGRCSSMQDNSSGTHSEIVPVTGFIWHYLPV